MCSTLLLFQALQKWQLSFLVSIFCPEFALTAHVCRTKLVEVMEFQLSYLKSLKMMLLKCFTQYASKFGKHQWPQDWKRSFQCSSQSQRKAMPKNAQTTTQLHSSHTKYATAKSLQSCPTLCDSIDDSPPGSPSLGFSRQEHWSGLPFPSAMHESEK